MAEYNTQGGYDQVGGMGTNVHSGQNIGVTATGIGTGGGHGYEEGKHGGGGILHRSGSGSSSSSEDDGMGGRRKKKGVIEKIKEKLPGGDHGSHEHNTTSATIGGARGGYGHEGVGGGYGHEGVGGGYGHEGAGEKHEKKGIMEKIKEKLPGGDHGNHEHNTTSATVGGAGGGYGHEGSGGGYGHAGEDQHEKKGIMEKIKEKLSSGDHDNHEHNTTSATVGGAGGGYGHEGAGGGYGHAGEDQHEKKGIMEKIKEKLPGGDHGNHEHNTTSATVGGAGGGYGHEGAGGGYGHAGEDQHEKKGIMGKIKEKLPGGDHGNHEHNTTSATVEGARGGYRHEGAGGGYGHAGEDQHEKKGIMEKIKEKLPGGDHGNHEHNTTSATVGGAGGGYGHEGAGGGYGHAGEDQHKKKGLMEKIKEKLPGGH